MKHIVIIEANKIQAEYIQSMLDSDSHTFESFENGETAYHQLYNNNYKHAVILLSYHLPGMNGIEIMTKLQEGGRDYAFVFFTANKTVETAIEAMKAGALDFIPKNTQLNVHLPKIVEKVYQLQQTKIAKDKIEQELEFGRIRHETIMKAVESGIVLIKLEDKRITELNPKAAELIGASIDKILNRSQSRHFIEHKNSKLKEKFHESFESRLITETYEQVPILKTIVPVSIYNEDYWLINFIDITKQKEINKKLVKQNKEIQDKSEEIEKQHVKMQAQLEEIVHQRQNITASIRYAQRIQKAILPPDELFFSIFPKSFVIYLPRDIVSGDFYWLKEDTNRIILIAADSTGHGVPGAFMSVLGSTLLNQIVSQNPNMQAADILNQLRASLINALRQTGKSGESKDGMDMSIALFNPEKYQMQFAGANSNGYLIRKKDNEIIELKGDKMPIGIHRRYKQPFTNHDFSLERGDKVYFFSDGYPDQFGGEDGGKFLRKRLRNKIEEYSGLDFGEQKKRFEEDLEKWKGKFEQIDDILLMGAEMNFDSYARNYSQAANWSEKTILVVEDETENYFLISELLSSQAPRLLHAENGTEAIELFKSNQDISLIIMDIHMPEMDGIETIKQIRTLDFDIPIIIITALTQSSDKEKGFRAGCNDYITKPLHSGELVATIRKYL